MLRILWQIWLSCVIELLGLLMDISCNSIPFLYSLNMDQDALSACTLRGLRWGSLFLCNTETKSSLTQNWLELSMKSYLTILIHFEGNKLSKTLFSQKCKIKKLAKTWQFYSLLYSKGARGRNSHDVISQVNHTKVDNLHTASCSRGLSRDLYELTYS